MYGETTRLKRDDSQSARLIKEIKYTSCNNTIIEFNETSGLVSHNNHISSYSIN